MSVEAKLAEIRKAANGDLCFPSKKEWRKALSEHCLRLVSSVELLLWGLGGKPCKDDAEVERILSGKYADPAVFPPGPEHKSLRDPTHTSELEEAWYRKLDEQAETSVPPGHERDARLAEIERGRARLYRMTNLMGQLIPAYVATEIQALYERIAELAARLECGKGQGNEQ